MSQPSPDQYAIYAFKDRRAAHGHSGEPKVVSLWGYHIHPIYSDDVPTSPPPSRRGSLALFGKQPSPPPTNPTPSCVKIFIVPSKSFSRPTKVLTEVSYTVNPIEIADIKRSVKQLYKIGAVKSADYDRTVQSIMGSSHPQLKTREEAKLLKTWPEYSQNWMRKALINAGRYVDTGDKRSSRMDILNKIFERAVAVKK